VFSLSVNLGPLYIELLEFVNPLYKKYPDKFLIKVGDNVFQAC